MQAKNKKIKYKGLSKSTVRSRSIPISGKKYRETTPFLSPLEFANAYEKIDLKNGYFKIVKNTK